MGAVYSAARRKVLRYNVEERAFKVLERPKPTPAPHHEVTEALEQSAKKGFDFSMLHEKKEDLHERLRSIYVQSGPVERATNTNPDRPLPQSRDAVEQYEYGLREPEKIPPGRLTVRTALEMIGKHASDPRSFTATVLSTEFVLKEQLTDAVLRNFRLLQMQHLEEPGPVKGMKGPTMKLAQPLIYRPPSELPPGEKVEEKSTQKA